LDWSLFFTFLILLGLELVLGVDNIIMVGMIAGQCPAEKQEATRKLGIVLAAVGRILLLSFVGLLMGLTAPVLSVGSFMLSWKDLILLAGGLFLLYKAVVEIHHAVAPGEHEEGGVARKSLTTVSAVAQICALDLVFSIDSVITAVGLTDSMLVMFTAVIAAAIFVFFASGPIIHFIRKNPALKVLALSFLVVVGVVICMEALGQHVPKAYVYLPLGFCLVVEMLQMLQAKNHHKK